MIKSIKKFHLIIEKNSLEESKSGSITGIVYFDFGEKKFPEDDWNDFVVKILGWWLEAIIRLCKGLSDEEDLLFMDGPVRIKIIRMENNCFEMKCLIEKISTIVEECTSIISRENLISGILPAIEDTLKIIRKNQWFSDDIANLNNLFKEFIIVVSLANNPSGVESDEN